jgi:glycosyltransferase involved in cell wall biosynthesis
MIPMAESQTIMLEMLNGSREKLRALLIDLSEHLDGASRRVLEILRHLPGGQGALACLTDSPVARQAARLDLPIHTVGTSQDDPRIVSRLVRIIRQGGFQVLDAQNPPATWWGGLASMRTGTAFVVTLNNWSAYERQGGESGRFQHTAERTIRPNTSLFIAASQEIYDRLLTSGVPEEAITLIVDAVDIDPRVIGVDKHRLCAAFGLPPRSVVCCAVGRLVEARGYRHLVNSFARLKDAIPDLYCLVVGEGPLRRPLEAQIEAAGLNGRVRLLGPRDRNEVLAILKASDMFLMPSLIEGTPVALLEAAALGTPIIASRVGSIPHIVHHGEHALLVGAGDEAGLAAAIRQLHDQPEEAAHLGKRAQARIFAEFSLASQVAATQRAYVAAWERHKQHRLQRL